MFVDFLGCVPPVYIREVYLHQQYSMLVCEPCREREKEKTPGQPQSEAVGEQSKNRCGNSVGQIFNRVRKLPLWQLCRYVSCQH